MTPKEAKHNQLKAELDIQLAMAKASGHDIEAGTWDNDGPSPRKDHFIIITLGVKLAEAKT